MKPLSRIQHRKQTPTELKDNRQSHYGSMKIQDTLLVANK